MGDSAEKKTIRFDDNLDSIRFDETIGIAIAGSRSFLKSRIPGLPAPKSRIFGIEKLIIAE